MIRKSLMLLGLGFLFLLLCCIPLVKFSTYLLVREVPLAKADWIIVLGGESSQRVLGAAELYRRQVAPNIFVTGSGDCRIIVKRLKLAGVPGAHIRSECESRSTLENSLFTKRYLQNQNIQSAILVTSWYHSYRAWFTFRKIWPQVVWGTYIVYPGVSLPAFGTIYESGAILFEYVKILYYWMYLLG